MANKDWKTTKKEGKNKTLKQKTFWQQKGKADKEHWQEKSKKNMKGKTHNHKAKKYKNKLNW